jgi:hypothetical protein
MPDPLLGALGFAPRRAKELTLLGSVGAGNTIQGWAVPKNASMVFMLCIGGGGGGGGGFSAASGSAKAGGAGGGPGATCRMMIPAYFLPKQLYLWAGNGGVGGSGSGVAGVGGTHSFIQDTGGTTAVNGTEDLIICSGINVAGGGGAGTASSSTGGVAETVFSTAASTVYAGVGIWLAHAGQSAGIAGNITGTPGGVTWGAQGSSNPSICTAGGAGGGATASNAAFSGSQVSLFQNGSSGGYTATGGAGVAGGPGGNAQGGGFRMGGRTGLGGWCFGGGSGGGACATAGTGGSGGNGGPGCGGGGGGAGVTGGAGGNGGPGLIYIAWW